jgi:uracil-DNA glycosylase
LIGFLESWAKQGVLMLNAVLTVRENQPGSHAGKGWEEFTTAVIQNLSEHREKLVYLLWGNYAQKKAEMINANKNLILKSTHPSPFSAHQGFLGCGHFSKTNQYLIKTGQIPIDWRL